MSLVLRPNPAGQNTAIEIISGALIILVGVFLYTGSSHSSSGI